MCMTLMIGATLLSAAGTIQQGRQAAAAGEFNARQAEADATAAKGEAQVQADKVRKAMKTQQSEATAALASSGVEVGVGTAELIERDIYQRGEEDALSVILTGNRRAKALETQAQMSRIQGRNARRAANVSALGQIAGAAVSASGWKPGSGFADFSRTPAPIETRTIGG